MKRKTLLCALCLLTLFQVARAIPNSFFGNGFFPIVVPAHPRFNANLTEDVLTHVNWENNAFPGPWEDAQAVTGQAVRQMTAMPVLFGAVPLSVTAYTEDERMTEIAINYLDAGTFFGYKAGGEKNHRERQAGDERRSEFDHHFRALSTDLRSRLEAGCGNGKMTILGRSTMLRTAFTDFQWDGFVLRLATRDGHSVALHIMREEDAAQSFVDEETASLRPEKRREELASNVRHNGRNDVFLNEIPMFTQSNTPFCGIHSLAMVAHYLGLRVRPDALAACAGFRNTGSARGSEVLDLYHAAAEELDMRVSVSSKFDFDRARKSIEAGIPVIVWRRVSMEREAAHNRFLAELARSPDATLPPPTKAQEAKWPERKKKGSPSHASVISGLNEELGEVIFTEPWGEHARERHMRVEEMETTAYAVFYFRF